MRITQFLLAVVWSLSLTYCSSPERSNLNYLGEKVSNAKHLGKGVWTPIPSNFYKAKTYDGFQSPSKTSSISVRIEETPVEYHRALYDTKTLKSQKKKLLEIREVIYAKVDTGFFALDLDRKGVLHYNLFIPKDGKTYWLRAFCFEAEKSFYNGYIRSA
ncbi:MAG: hypothetical protein AAF242_11805, partial [Bacteroidota bacterium]